MAQAVLERSIFLRPTAHRGLHNEIAGIFENSAPAFEAAIQSGFSIECDVRAAGGGVPVVFHDADCRRLLGRPEEIAGIDAAGIAALSYPDGSPVLTFAAFLELVGGRSPALVELKCDFASCDFAFLEELARLWRKYSGPLAAMSFEPDLMCALAQLVPDVPRGLVAAAFSETSEAVRRLGAKQASRLSCLEAFEATGASFVAYDVDGLPNAATERLRASGVPVFAWTVRNQAQLEIACAFADAPIFEVPIDQSLDRPAQ